MEIQELSKELESIAGFFAYRNLDAEFKKSGLKRLNNLFSSLGIKAKVHFARKRFVIRSEGPLPDDMKSNVSAIMVHLCKVINRRSGELDEVCDIMGEQFRECEE